LAVNLAHSTATGKLLVRLSHCALLLFFFFF
jgi:hypothetical protein